MSSLEDFKINVRLKLAALWTTTMSCYIYCDFMELYVPGKVRDMLEGRMGELGPTTQGLLLTTSSIIALPSVMIFLSLALRPAACRWANIVLGACFTLLLAMEAIDASWYFYKMFAAVEACLTALVVVYAWKWPRTRDAQPA